MTFLNVEVLFLMTQSFYWIVTKQGLKWHFLPKNLEVDQYSGIIGSMTFSVKKLLLA